MPDVSRSELLRELKADVDLLASPSDLQLAWLNSTGFPVDEMAQQYFSEVPAWIPQLSEANLLSPSAVQALNTLRDALMAMVNDGPDSMFSDDGLEAPEWHRIRTLARLASNQIQQWHA